MSKEVNKILKEQLELVKPSEEDNNKIDNIWDNFSKDLRASLKSKKINAEVFLGGSLAKGTLVKKNVYDIDVFVRFNKSYPDSEISGLLGKVLGKVKKIHGSRDYYQKLVDEIIIEIIPVLNIKKPEEAVNVTDLSYFHVNYVLNKIKKDKKLIDEIRLAKNFAHAQYCYGAEGYIHGFSGYALELLICHYGSFFKFISEISRLDLKEEKLIIDDSKFYKNNEEVLIELNKSKQQGPIILIDPTFRERNSLSGLSSDTFFKFRNACSGFLKNPSSEFFERKDIGEEFQKFEDVKVIKVKTSRQAGDIAGTKSRKFFDFFVYKMDREFVIRKSEFYYDENENIANFYFVVDKKKEEVVRGPPIIAVQNLTSFKRAHPDAFIKKGFAYVKDRHAMSFDDWFERFVKVEKKVIKGMDVKGIKRV